MDEKLNVFISWSGPCALEIGRELKALLRKLFNCINVYISEEDIMPGDKWRNHISEGLEKSDYGILILTSTNIKAPWLMFEAGALSKTTGKAMVIPILFGREVNQVEGPISVYQCIGYKKKDIFALVKSLYNYLIKLRLLSGISGDSLHDLFKSDDYWDEFERKINEILKEYKFHHQSKEKTGKVKRQFGINFSTQTVFGGDNKPETIRDIPDKLLEFLKSNISSEYRFKLVNKEKGDKEEILMINDTRISTFIAITDGSRLLVFDRDAAEDTHLGRENNNYDVFGSVPFSVSSLEKKIGNKEFLESKIEKIEPISALAIEDNTDERDLPLETVVMFGYAVFISEEDLESAVISDNEHCIQLDDLEVNIENYTAKAKIARNAIIEMEKVGEPNGS